MANTHSTTARSKLYAGTGAEFTNVAGYQGDTWTEVKGLVDLGEIGDAAEAVTFKTIDNGRVQKLKGARDAGDIEVVVVRDSLDAGQAKMNLAQAADGGFNFKLVLDDKPDATGTPTELYFRGMVMSARNELGEADNVVKRKYTVAITSEIFEVLAEVGA